MQGILKHLFINTVQQFNVELFKLIEFQSWKETENYVAHLHHFTNEEIQGRIFFMDGHP